MVHVGRSHVGLRQAQACGGPLADQAVAALCDQLLPLAAQQWAAQFPDGFAPRFETTRSWAARVGSFTPGPHDWSGVHGRDWLTAAGLLEAAGFAAQRSLLTAPLLEQAAQLAPLAASLPPALRSDWMAHARAALPEAGDGPQALEALLARIATAWVGHSGHASDALFAPRVARALDALVIVPGLQHESAHHLGREEGRRVRVGRAHPSRRRELCPRELRAQRL